MAKGHHPNVQRRDPRSPHDSDEPITTIRAVVYVVDAERGKWVDEELADEPITVQVARSVEQVVSALVDDPPPRAQILVLDVDSIAPIDLLQLHQIRERGWFGAIVALGQVPAALRSSLSIAHVLMPPLRKNSLRNTITRAGIAMPTTRMPKIDG
ncbi:MAG TPA: hypothetical protein VGG74_29855 [Kofleriaceae bacterium]